MSNKFLTFFIFIYFVIASILYFIIPVKIKWLGLVYIVFMGIGEPLDNFDNVVKAISLIEKVISTHKEILLNPAPFVRMSQCDASSINITSRVWVKQEYYWDVYFDMIKEVKDIFDENQIEETMKKLLFIMSFSALVASCGNDMPVVELPEIDTTNPLLAEWDTPYATPPFDKIKITDYEPAIETAIAVSRAEVDAIINNPAKPSFANTIEALERQGELLGRILGVFFNLREADTSDEMDAIALRIQPKLTELSNDVSLNPQLFERVKAVYEGSQLFLSKDEKKLLEDTYKSFSRSGAALNHEDKALYRQYTAELSEATLLFAQNSLSATNAFSINITDEKQVAELPDFVKEGLAAEAKARGQKGWTVTLKAPSYGPFMMYSSQRDIKEKLYRAYNSRALGGEHDNSQIIRNIISLRMKIANLLGYKTHADYTLEERMAEVFAILERHRAKVHLVQNSAISMALCIDASRYMQEIVDDLHAGGFSVKYNTDMELLTIRGYTHEQLAQFVENEDVYMSQRSRKVLRILRRGK